VVSMSSARPELEMVGAGHRRLGFCVRRQHHRGQRVCGCRLRRRRDGTAAGTTPLTCCVDRRRRVSNVTTQLSSGVKLRHATERLEYTATARGLDGETSEDVGRGFTFAHAAPTDPWQLAQDI
jgi:hypothetical protein